MQRLIALLAALLALVALTSPLEAQRARGRGRGRTRRPAATAEPASPEAPENPFAEPAPAAGAGSSSPASATATGPSPTGGAGGAGAAAPPPPAAATTPPAAATTTAASPPPAADPGPAPPDVAPVRADLSQLMDDMVQTRQRMAVLGEELFRTRIRIAVQDRAGDDESLAHFVVELDGAPVFRTDGEIEGGDRGRTVHEGALAPGPHVLTIETEQRAREDAEIRYTQRETFRVQVHRDRLTDIEVVLEDDSSIVEQFHQGGEGRYEIRTRVQVATRELPAPGGS
ncbi:MAG: hypothetical protein K1X94_12565 [Sandaracinaceae bacterium]|nr:hypothetical protein [Sandaracinaceae bacterium]